MGANTSTAFRQPREIGSPVLESVVPVVANSRYVQTRVEKIIEVAGWMAYEELPLPEFFLPFSLGDDPDLITDFLLLATTLNFAFTDFVTKVVYEVDYGGRRWSDAMALFAGMKQALDAGVPFLDGAYLSRVTPDSLAEALRGVTPLPLLDERADILHGVGQHLAARYQGHFHNFVRSCSPKLYDSGNGLVERLVEEFPRFRDVSRYHGDEVKLYKLAQLAVWSLYSTLGASGAFRLDDPGKMTAFADYIVPAALRLLGILVYTPELEQTIQQRHLIARDSEEEVEIRSHTIYATALLTEEVNRLRPADRQVIIPHIDARLWSHYHTTFWPHHLTPTIMY